MLIVHIGLGKTGTTTLQKYFFGEMCKRFSFDYNPPEYMKIKAQRLIYSAEDKQALKTSLKGKNVLISQEGIAS